MSTICGTGGGVTPASAAAMYALKPVIFFDFAVSFQAAFSGGVSSCHAAAPALYSRRRAVCVADGAPVGWCQRFAVLRPAVWLNVMVRASAPRAVSECRGFLTVAMPLFDGDTAFLSS